VAATSRLFRTCSQAVRLIGLKLDNAYTGDRRKETTLTAHNSAQVRAGLTSPTNCSNADDGV
jgi:hypothetical protein